MRKRTQIFNILLLPMTAFLIQVAFAIAPNQYDNFKNGTTQGWGSGGNNPNPPLNITSGGPAGANDNYLLAVANGGAGSGSKLVIINSSQWTGDYISAGVQFISMYIKNFSDTTLSMRIVLRGPGGDFWSLNPINISGLTGWQPITFSVQPSDLTGGADVNSTLGGVTSVRILHSVSGGFTGDAIEAQIGLDNISAAAEPLPFELSLTALVEGFYDGSLMISDSVTVELRNVSSPYTLVDKKEIVLSSLGQGSGLFTSLTNAALYYLVIKHRNSIEAWSANPHSFNLGSLSYNFTDDSSKAFGNNLTKRGTKWCIYSGDINRDEFIDGSDVSDCFNDASIGQSGYVVTDLTGDDFVDGTDVSIVFNNSSIGIGAIYP